MGSLVTQVELDALTDIVSADLPDFLVELRYLVDIDCGSYTKAGVDQVGRWVEAAFAELGADIERHPHDRFGDTVVGIMAAGKGDPGRSADAPTALLIGHMDTVFDPGTVAERPFRIEGGTAYGPGVTDMKSGLLAGIHALRAIRTLMARRSPDASGVFDGTPAGWLPVGRLVFVANPDEEIGSPVSSALIRSYAADADLAYVLECARANGDIVSSRKGIVDLELHIQGRAAHAGVEPEKGRSAVLEAAHKTVALDALNGLWPGVTVNVGVVSGGTRPNVVAERATLTVDIRAVERSQLEAAERAVAAIVGSMTVPDTTCDVVELGRHWPMEKLERSGRLVDHAIGLAGQLGFSLHDTATGGASDANTTAGMGVPTIDGMGPIGGHDHAPTEYLELDSIVPRTVLLAALLLAAGRDPVVRDWHVERLARAAAAGATT